MKRILFAAALLASAGAGAQTLFTYGTDSVSVPEFLAAYNKNSGAAKGPGGINDYLDLYISSRLKVKEARRLGYDTLPQMVTDLQNLREQLLPTYLNDLAGVDGLVREAAERSKKNIRIAHIFIAAKGVDTAMAWSKVKAALGELKGGKSFSTVARSYSEDPSVKTNGGDIGWITPFVLPYELENLAWSTKPGGPALVYRSKAGYHIFRNLGERPDPGTVKAAQILLAFPPGASDAEKAALKKRADSLYARLLKGDDFGKLAAKFSNDVISAANNGELPDIGVGQYDPAFEEKLFGLSKDGALSAPFQTAHGWHIVKRIKRTPRYGKDSTAALQAIREQVERSDRMSIVQTQLAQNIKKQAGYQELPVAEADLRAYTDSLLDYVKPARRLSVNDSTPLLRIGTQTFTASDWTRWAGSNRYKSDGTGAKPFAQLWREFTDASAIEFYRAHLETYNPKFRAQMEEFRDGNLFFEIMQREVWSPGQSDSAGLQNYFNAHRDKYVWKSSADAVLFYAPDSASAHVAQAMVAKKPFSWRNSVSNYDERIAIDSARFELDQIPNPTKLPLKAGTVTAVQVNSGDGSATFAVVLRLRPDSGPRSFAEARGLVITDYQKELEEKWVNSLRARYPVTINQPALLELMKKK
ncbi:peptidylprolyl isomerase [Flaviaesturariibacter terrae]